MNITLPIDTELKLIKLRNILDGISQISWSFSVLNKRHPIGVIDNEMDADALSQAYTELIDEARFLLDKQV